VNLSSPSRGAAVGEGSGDARRHSRLRLAQNALLLVMMASITCFYAIDYDKRAKGTDFAHIYASARMVHEGYGHQLYDFQTQDQFQIRYVGRTGTYYNHPPFETLLYLPLSLFSLQTAYLLWCVLNVAFLTWTAILLQKHVVNRVDWRVLLPLFFLFPPVLVNFQQGQDSLLLLLIMTLAVVELTRNRNFRAGCLLGCGLFKFHIVLTLVVLLVLLRRRGLLRGFAVAFVTLLLISAGISGWSFLTAYPCFLRNLSSLPLAGIHPAAMANIRGLVSVSGIVPDTAVRLALTWIGSVLLLWYAATKVRNRRSKFTGDTTLLFGNFVLAAILVSYHLSPSDLCIALLPIGLLSASLMKDTGMPRWARVSLLSCLCLLFLPPFHLILLAWHVYAYASIPILIMFLITSAGIGRKCEAEQ
jgi:Glycosyltransferase family 87